MFHTMKIFKFLLFIGFATSLLFSVLLYFGIIWFNNPSTEEFPISGIDISNHQGIIDWTIVPTQKVKFVYIKVTEGGDFVDKSAKLNIQNAKEAKIPIGVYHFFTLCKSGKEQAQNFISNVNPNDIALPPAIDLEFVGNCSGRPTVEEFQEELREFILKVTNHFKVKPILQITYDFIEKYPVKDFHLDYWVRDIFFRPKSDLKWKIWQYTEREKVKGINGFIDMNVFNGTEIEFQIWIKK